MMSITNTHSIAPDDAGGDLQETAITMHQQKKNNNDNNKQKNP
jgi:hypothetical protein